MPVLDPRGYIRFFKYMETVIKNKGCRLLAINAVPNHLHLLIFLHPSVAMASFVHDVKISSGNFIRRTKIFPLFETWQDKYSAFSYHTQARPGLKKYIANQEEHHKDLGLIEELQRLYDEHGLEWNASCLD